MGLGGVQLHKPPALVSPQYPNEGARSTPEGSRLHQTTGRTFRWALPYRLCRELIHMSKGRDGASPALLPDPHCPHTPLLGNQRGCPDSGSVCGPQHQADLAQAWLRVKHPSIITIPSMSTMSPSSPTPPCLLSLHHHHSPLHAYHPSALCSLQGFLLAWLSL